MDRNTGIGRDQLRDYTLKRQDLSPDGLVWQEPVIDKDLTTPPVSGVAEDDRYLIISGSGDWSGHDNDIAHYHSGQWNYYTPIEGWFVWINDENKLYRFNGSSWAEFSDRTVEDIEWYIDPIGGSDVTGDGSDPNPFATFNHALSLLPKEINHTVVLWGTTSSYTENIVIEGFTGSGSIEIADIELIESLAPFLVKNNNCLIIFNDIIAKVTANSANCFKIENSHVELTAEVDSGSYNNTVGIRAQGVNSNINIADLYDGTNIVAIGIHVSQGAIVTYSSELTGTTKSYTETGGIAIGYSLNLFKSDYDDAIAKKHNRQHSIVDSNDHSDKADYIDATLSPTILTGATISEGTNAGTFKVTALTALLRKTASDTGELVKITLAEQDNEAITSPDIEYYIVLEYNSGTPRIEISTSRPNGQTNLCIGRVMRESDNTVHYINSGCRVANGFHKLHQRASELRRTEISEGFQIVDKGSKKFSIAEGISYRGINRFTFPAFDTSISAPDTFTYVYYNYDTSSWVYNNSQTEIDVDNYNLVTSGTGLTACNKYKCDWVFIHPDMTHVFIVYGQDNLNLANIEQSSVPDVPDLVDKFGVLIGRIIVEGGIATFEAIEMVENVTFNPKTVTEHNELSGLDGGQVGEYYHLKSSEHTSVVKTTVGITIDGGGEVLETGYKGFIRIPYACTITKVTLLADVSGSVVIDIWKDTYANYPPTDADSITASAPPTISSATKSEDSTLSGWTTAISAGDILAFNVDSITDITKVVLILEITKT